jgi:hypothetical protein
LILQFAEDPDNSAINEGKKPSVISGPPTIGKVPQNVDSFQRIAAMVNSAFQKLLGCENQFRISGKA